MANIVTAGKWLLVAVCAMLAMGCRPLPYYIEKPEGPPDYQLGWQDGCDSKLSQAPGFYKMVYGFKKRPEMIGNDLYNQGWSNGFFYCAWPD
jgi:hypothetical protein